MQHPSNNISIHIPKNQSINDVDYFPKRWTAFYFNDYVDIVHENVNIFLKQGKFCLEFAYQQQSEYPYIEVTECLSVCVAKDLVNCWTDIFLFYINYIADGKD